MPGFVALTSDRALLTARRAREGNIEDAAPDDASRVPLRRAFASGVC